MANIVAMLAFMACFTQLVWLCESSSDESCAADDSECQAKSPRKSGDAMIQIQRHFNEGQGEGKAVRDEVEYELVGNDLRCHPKYRRMKKWGDLGNETEDVEQCQAKCTAIADCKYVTIRKGVCTSFTACDLKQYGTHGALRHRTWKKIDNAPPTPAPVKPTCSPYRRWSFLNYYYSFCQDINWEGWDEYACQESCASDNKWEKGQFCLQNVCPECGVCEAPDEPPVACWDGSVRLRIKEDSERYEGEQKWDEIETRTWFGSYFPGCGTLDFHYSPWKICNNTKSLTKELAFRRKIWYETWSGRWSQKNVYNWGPWHYDDFEPCGLRASKEER